MHLAATMLLMEVIDRERLERLRDCADEARGMHYAPYSKFLVLAAVETVGGRMYSGANVEIINYSLTKHAEEVAILAAIVGGQDPWQPWLRAIYVAGGAPCGSCRQFIAEFATDDAICVFEDVDQGQLRADGLPSAAASGNPEVRTMGELLPDRFDPEALRGKPAP
jgi:cytidine deaminase